MSLKRERPKARASCEQSAGALQARGPPPTSVLNRPKENAGCCGRARLRNASPGERATAALAPVVQEEPNEQQIPSWSRLELGIAWALTPVKARLQGVGQARAAVAVDQDILELGRSVSSKPIAQSADVANFPHRFCFPRSRPLFRARSLKARCRCRRGQPPSCGPPMSNG